MQDSGCRFERSWINGKAVQKGIMCGICAKSRIWINQACASKVSFEDIFLIKKKDLDPQNEVGSKIAKWTYLKELKIPFKKFFLSLCCNELTSFMDLMHFKMLTLCCTDN